MGVAHTFVGRLENIFQKGRERNIEGAVARNRGEMIRLEDKKNYFGFSNLR